MRLNRGSLDPDAQTQISSKGISLLSIVSNILIGLAWVKDTTPTNSHPLQKDLFLCVWGGQVYGYRSSGPLELELQAIISHLM